MDIQHADLLNRQPENELIEPILSPDLNSAIAIQSRSEALTHMCWTCGSCGECSSGCPVSFERTIFDARTLFRMATLGLMDRVLNSPSLWLCVECGRCSDACSQLVDGRNLIGDLQQMAIARGVVDAGFRLRLHEANRSIYRHLLDHIDSALFFA